MKASAPFPLTEELLDDDNAILEDLIRDHGESLPERGDADAWAWHNTLVGILHGRWVDRRLD